MKLVPCLRQQCLGSVNMLSAVALHEIWAFGHLSSYLFRI